MEFSSVILFSLMFPVITITFANFQVRTLPLPKGKKIGKAFDSFIYEHFINEYLVTFLINVNISI